MISPAPLVAQTKRRSQTRQRLRYDYDSDAEAILHASHVSHQVLLRRAIVLGVKGERGVDDVPQNRQHRGVDRARLVAHEERLVAEVAGQRVDVGARTPIDHVARHAAPAAIHELVENAKPEVVAERAQAGRHIVGSGDDAQILFPVRGFAPARLDHRHPVGVLVDHANKRRHHRAVGGVGALVERIAVFTLQIFDNVRRVVDGGAVAVGDARQFTGRRVAIRRVRSCGFISYF